MVNKPILARFPGIAYLAQAKRPNLQGAFHNPSKLPAFVLECPSAMRTLDLLGPLDWAGFPERNLIRNWGKVVVPHAAFSAACLLKLNEHLVSMGDLHQYLLEHPAFIWLLGFPITPSLRHPCGFDPHNSLPTERHLTRMLRETSNLSMQFLFEDSIRLLLGYFASQGIHAGECILK